MISLITYSLDLFRPIGFDALGAEEILVLRQEVAFFADRSWDRLLLQGETDKRASRFTDAPFGWVQAVIAVGDVRRSDVLIRRNQIVHPLR